MRIGINASFLGKPMTGIGQVTREFLKQLAKSQEFSQYEWYLYTDGELNEELKKDIGQANWQWRPVKTWWSRQDIPHQYLFESEMLPYVVDGDDVDVFLSLYQSATVLPKEIRHLMLVHDLIPKIFPEYLNKWTSRFHYRKIQKGIKMATAIIVPSTTTKSDVSNLLEIPVGKITVATLGIDKRFFEHLDEASLRQVLKKYDLVPGYFYHGGGLEIRKNTEAVLRAYADLLKEDSSLPPMVVSGKIHAETNPLATPVERLVKELHLEEKVKLLGLIPEEDLPFLYQGAAMFLFPSRYEGFGLPVLEAFASGAPVITTGAGSLKELTDRGEALLVHNVAQADDEIKASMKKLLAEPELTLQLRMKGSERAKEYSWENFAGAIIRALLQ